MDKKINDIKNNKMVDPATYGKDYYIHAYAGDVDKYLADLNDLPVSLASCFGLAKPRPKERVLDIGCGRGHLSYWCVINGCLVTAIDYNSDAIELTKLAMEKLPKELQANVVVKQQDIKTIDTSQKYDVIFMADLVEHLYDWELNVLFDKIKEILTRKTGRLLIHTTPNAIWIRYIYPLKRILNL